MPTKLFYTYREEHISGGEPLSDEEWCSYSDSHYSWRLQDVSVKAPKSTPYNGFVEVGKLIGDKWKAEEASVGDDVWVVVVQYSTGSTFGRSFGHGTVACICKNEDDAIDIKNAINSGWSGPGSVHFATWQGYFEDIESVYLERRIVLS